MTLAGYAGMLGTLAFVLALLLLVAKVAKRFLPGTIQAAGGDSFSVIQRIPLGQRQGIAIVQRGDVVIGVSVGDGGVRTLFTMPASVDASEASSANATSVSVDAVRMPIDKNASFRTTGTPLSAPVEPAWATVVEDDTTSGSIESGVEQAFRTVLRRAVTRSPVATAVLCAAMLMAAGAQRMHAQAAVTSPAPTRPATGAAPATRAVAATRTAPAQNTSAVVPSRTAPAPGAMRPGAPQSIAPLTPAAQANDIAALKQRAAGTAAPTTVTAQQIATRADSMLSKLAPQMELKVGGNAQGEGLRMSGTVGVVIMMGLLSLLPALLLMMTGFTRILVVLHFLKQALGTQSAPPGQLLAAMALLLTGFVMAPTLKEVNSNALEPWMAGQIEQVEMMSRATGPFKTFMLAQVRDQDLQTFVDLADIAQPATREAVPLTILMSAFVTSELRTAFQIGFALFLPFIVIDVVVSSVLMSMGMMMLPPAMISLPFKLLLFVLVDGWGLVVTGLVQSFR
jgi:flagellar biosynthesis protein FliP